MGTESIKRPNDVYGHPVKEGDKIKFTSVIIEPSIGLEDVIEIEDIAYYDKEDGVFKLRDSGYVLNIYDNFEILGKNNNKIFRK
jgi:hypothetical protein